MKVHELRKLLSHLDPDVDVVVVGYEGGYKDISNVEPIALLVDVNVEWYYGPHERADDWGIGHHPGAKRKLAVLVD